MTNKCEHTSHYQTCPAPPPGPGGWSPEPARYVIQLPSSFIARARTHSLTGNPTLDLSSLLWQDLPRSLPCRQPYRSLARL